MPRVSAGDASTRQPELRRFIGFLSASQSKKQPCFCSCMAGQGWLVLAADPSASPPSWCMVGTLDDYALVIAYLNSMFPCLCINQLRQTNTEAVMNCRCLCCSAFEVARGRQVSPHEICGAHFNDVASRRLSLSSASGPMAVDLPQWHIKERGREIILAIDCIHCGARRSLGLVIRCEAYHLQGIN